jgi:adhesin transport system outer membrane protein
MQHYRTKSALITTLVISLLWVVNPAVADPVQVNQIVKKAIENNPDVNAKWHEFLASGYEVGAAQSGYRPSVDFNADYGFQTRNYGPNSEFTGGEAALTVTQMLYDGFETRFNIERFENTRLVRYFELMDAVEMVSLESFIAYQDVLRHRELVRLARDNFKEHQRVYNQIEKSTKAGVARRADFEQANGRLALAESNLFTELSNLHDVSARYLRIVGELPVDEMNPAEFNDQLIPQDIQTVMELAYQGNPGFHAAIRNIHAAESTVKTEKSNFQPRLNLTARYGVRDYDDLGNSQNRQDGRIALEFSYNFYSGGRDQANLNRAFEEVNVAKDLRHKACIDMRQELQIAYNDTIKLQEQIPVLNQHRLSSNRVRAAYSDQFDIGQRTLLDMLDAENEYFQSSRAHTDAKFNYNIALARVLAGMGQLVTTLEVTRNALPSLQDLSAEQVKIHAEYACPAPDIRETLKQPVLDTDKDGVPDHQDLCPNTPITDKVDEKGCSIFDEKEINQTLKIEFDVDSSVVKQEYKAAIGELADLLKRFPETVVEIQGHASKQGSARYNRELSQRRADSVAKVLIEEFGIAADRVTSIGYGFSRPLLDFLTPEAHSVNRRIEAKVTGKSQEVVKR